VWLSAERSYWRDNSTVQDFATTPRIYLGVMNMFGDPTLRFSGTELPGQRDIAVSSPAACCGSLTNNVQLQPVLYRNSAGDVYDGALDLTTSTGAPKAKGSLAAYYWNADSTMQAVFIGSDRHAHELYQVNGSAWQTDDLTAVTGAPPAALGSAITGYAWESRSTKQVAYLSGDGHVHLLQVAVGGGWSQTDLTAATSAPVATNNSPLVGYAWESGGSEQVAYLTSDGHVHELYWNGSGQPDGGGPGWAHIDLTQYTGAPPATGTSLTAYGWDSDKTKQVAFVTADGHIHELYVSVGGNWQTIDLTQTAGSVPANIESPIVGYSWDYAKTKQVDFVSADGHVHEISVSTTRGWGDSDLTALTNAPATTGQISGAGESSANVAATGQGPARTLSPDKTVAFPAGDGHVYTIVTTTSGSSLVDVTASNGAPNRW